MPIFVYGCQNCGHTFEELLLSRDAEAALVCPKCKSDALARKLGTFAMISGLRGSEDSFDSDNGNDSEQSCGNGACPSCDFDD